MPPNLRLFYQTNKVVLRDNLLNPVWEEVLLLYMAMSPPGRANEYSERLMAMSTPDDMHGVFIAARALTEKIPAQEQTRHSVLNGLHAALQSSIPTSRKRACELLESLGTGESASLLVHVLQTDSEVQVRYTAGLALGRLGDPRFDSLGPEMLDVPAGEFVMGSETYSNEKPPHPVTLPRFRISRYLVTNCDYKRFLQERAYQAPYNWVGTEYPEGRSNQPVVNVSWNDARTYCDWLSHKTGKVYRLPTEAEWEKAARGTDSRTYPWGNEFEKDKCNTAESDIGTTSPVGIYPDGSSPYGALDMSGNVWEWCSTIYRGYPYSSADGRESLDLAPPGKSNILERGLRRGSKMDSEIYRVLRGGSFDYYLVNARCANRDRNNPDIRGYLIGFRVAQSVLP